MLHRFATYEEAALFVSKKRSEGFYAEILHDNASSFWGSLAVNGVGVLVSEEKVEDEREVPDLEPDLFRLPKELSKLLGGATLGAVSGYFLWLIMQGALPALVVLIVLMALLGLLFIFLVAVITVMLLPWRRALRDTSSPHHELAMNVLFWIAILMAISLVVFARYYEALGA
ncbi:MAG: hypothetical protein R3242_09010 [Akkermansiaceae bacterium]|nr:hypothetical protein [Akkermansiaceae bacterium]